MQIPQRTECAQTSVFSLLAAADSSRIYDAKKLGGGLSDCHYESFTSQVANNNVEFEM